MAKSKLSLPWATKEAKAGDRLPYRALVDELALKLVDLAQLTRLATTGRTASPPLFDVLALLGREEVLHRLRAAAAVARGAP